MTKSGKTGPHKKERRMRPLTKIRWMIRPVANCCKGS
jgi:hypothetical protein